MSPRLIKSQINVFLQQQADHAWLMIPLNGRHGCDEFKNTVVYSTFPASLTQEQFSSYIDTTFHDIDLTIKTKMKGLFIVNKQTFRSEEVVFDYVTTTGKISASLIQIIAERNEQKELTVLVGAISLIRKPPENWYFKNDYWKSDKARVLRGLQYIFANEAQKEIEYME